VPQALAAVHEAVHAGNAALATGDSNGAGKHLVEVRAMLGVLGLDPLSEPWSAGGGSEGLREIIDALVTVALDQRQAAKARKDYETADAIRDGLLAAGIAVEDTPRGTRWELGR
jgi:cysteinyl-tRNA synthetase